MNANRSFRIVDIAFGCIFMLFLSFLLASSLWPKEGHTLPSAILWALVSATSCYFILDALNYFETFKPLPSRAKYFTLLIALPWAPLVANFILGAILDHGIIRHRGIYMITPLAAIFVLGYQYIAGLFFIKNNHTKKILALLNEKDAAELKEELRTLKLSNYFEFSTNPQEKKADLIVISRSGARDFTNNLELIYAHLNATPIIDVRTLLTELRGRVSIDNTDLWLYLQTATKQTGTSRVYFSLKMFFEPVLGILLGIVLLPFFLLIALLVKASSSGPIFFSQSRTGYRGKIFQLYKFRTMRVDSNKLEASWANNDQHRITVIGSFLRKSHLDELPQLWNIIKGELSFVGPRPERPEFYSLLKNPIPLFDLRTMVRPGITGWAQIMGGYAGSVEESKNKLEYDLYYMQHLSMRMDFVVLIKTFFMFLSFRDPKAF